MSAEQTQNITTTIPSSQLYLPAIPEGTLRKIISEMIPNTSTSFTLRTSGLHIDITGINRDDFTHTEAQSAAQAIALRTHLPVTLSTPLQPREPEEHSPHVTSADESAHLVRGEPLIRTAVLHNQFSDIFRDVQPSTLADLFSEHTIRSALLPAGEKFQPPLKNIHAVLSKWLEKGDFKVIGQRTFLQIIVHGDESLVTEPAFHDLCRELFAENPQGYPLLITIVPETSTDTHQPHNSVGAQKEGVQERFSAALGKKEDLAITIETVQPSVPPTMETLGKLADTVRALLKIKGFARWLDVRTESGRIALYPQCCLPDHAIQTIQKKLALVPAPIHMQMPQEAKNSFSVADLKSVIKLVLPATATLVRTEARIEGEIQLIKVRILASPVDKSSLEEQLKYLSKGFRSVGQELTYIVDTYSEELAARLGMFHPHSLRTILRQSRQGGTIIPLDSFSYREPPLRPSENKHLLLHQYKYNHGARPYSEAAVFTLDGQRAGSLHEDAFSVEHTKDAVMVGIHVVNGAFLVGPTSYERLCAYHNGTTTYGAGGFHASMLPGLRKFGFRNNDPIPAISLFITADSARLNSGVFDAHEIRIQLTEITPSAAERYNEHDTEVPYRGRYRKEVSVLQALAGAIRNTHYEGTDMSGSVASLSRDIQSLLGFFNNHIVQTLGTHGTPLIYLHTERPTIEQLERCIEQIKQVVHDPHPLFEMCKLGARSILGSESRLSTFLSCAWDLRASGHVDLYVPGSDARLTMEPNLLNAVAGYHSYTPVNKALRDLPSLIAQHQLNAQLGIYAPLSISEVSGIHQRAEEHAAELHRLRRDLGLFYDLTVLTHHANTGMPGVIVTPSGRGHPYTKIPALHEQGRFTHMVEGPERVRKLARKHTSTKEVTVWPQYYDVEQDVICVASRKPKH